MTTPCSRCSAALPLDARFCGRCGARQAEPAVQGMEGALATLQLHLSHDYRREQRDAAGRVVAIFGLGAPESTVNTLLRALPGHRAVEISRQPGVGTVCDWLRVDIIPR